MTVDDAGNLNKASDIVYGKKGVLRDRRRCRRAQGGEPRSFGSGRCGVTVGDVDNLNKDRNQR